MTNRQATGRRAPAESLLVLNNGDVGAAYYGNLSRHIYYYEGAATFGQKLADRVAAIGGSWGFLIAFRIAMSAWIAINTIVLATRAVDPYPFVFLNLMLSLLAAVQAPVILMAQNRQAVRDRLAAAHDYEVNLKAEIEIAALHEKLDQIRTNELATLIRTMESKIEGKG